VRRPLLLLSALFGIGCLVADESAGVREAAFLAAAAALLLPLGWWAPSRRWGAVAVGAAAVALGTAGRAIEGRHFEAGSVRVSAVQEVVGPVRLQGLARGDPVSRPESLTFLLDVEGREYRGRLEPATGRVSVVVGGAAARPSLADGDRVAVWARLRPTPHGEGVRGGVAARGYCKSPRLIDVLGRSGAGWLRTGIARARSRVRGTLVRAILPGTERGLVLAMVLGDRSELDDATTDAFRASGTYHVLALSGAQVALVAALLVALLGRLGVSWWGRAVVTGTAMALYSLLVGGDVPVVRAVLMATAVLAGRALELDADSGNLLGLAALLLLVAHPATVTDVGFQLSFGATLGLLALVGPLTCGLPRLPLRVELVVAASVAAQAALGPVLALWFHRLSPAALVMNLAAVPLSGAVLLTGLAVFVGAAVGTPASVVTLLGDVAWCAAHALRLSGDLGPLTTWLDLRVPPPSALAIAVHLSGLALLWRGRRGSGLGLLVASHVLIVLGPPPAPVDGRLHLTVLDVGQGDCLLLRSPGGRHILVDAGGTRGRHFDPGERLAAPELWRRGVRSIDAVLVTHAQLDHTAGLPYLLRAFRVGEIWEGPAPLGDHVWQGLDAAARAARVTRRSVAAGVAVPWDGAVLEVLGPAPPRRPPRQGRNEDSLVVCVRLGAVGFLLTGDVEGDGLRTLRVPDVDVVKVPHHGSRSTSPPAFVRAASPRLALVSVGAHNPFGHPDAGVLERYRRAGALVLRTDRDGALEVVTDGRRVWFRTAGEACERRIR
jgi:competence protein ComEC